MRIFSHALLAPIIAIVMVGDAQQAFAASSTPFAQNSVKDCKTQQGCSVAFPLVTAGTRLEIQHISCEDRISDTTPNLIQVHLDIFESNTIKAVYSMSPHRNGELGNFVYWVTDEQTFAPVTEGRRPVVIATIDKAPATRTINCTISGYRDVL